MRLRYARLRKRIEKLAGEVDAKDGELQIIPVLAEEATKLCR